MAVAEKPLTLEQFLALSEEEPSLEYVDGVVTQKVPAGGRHSALQAGLVIALNDAGRPANVARAFPELRLTFAAGSVVPDIAVLRWDRIPRDASGELAEDFFEPPDVAVDIASLEQSVNGQVRRCLWYVSHGVHVALLVDPDDDSILAFRPGSSLTALTGTDLIDLSEVLPSFKLTVHELFESLRV